MATTIPPVTIDKEIGVTTDTTPGIPAHVNLNLTGLKPTDIPVVNTNWSKIDIRIPDKPDLSIATPSEQDAGNLPSEVNYDDPKVPDVTAEFFSDVYEDTQGSVAIPTPPNIKINVFAGAIPSFSLDPANKNLDWIYADYASDLLTILKDRVDELLVDPLPLDTTWVIAKHNQIYDDKPMFLEARGIKPLTTRHNLEKFLFRDNVHRLISIMEDDNVNKNDRLYLETRQSLENFERSIYDSKKIGELAFAKSFADVRIKNYQSTMESYNQMLAEFRAESDFFMEKIDAEKATLDKYKNEIGNYRLVGQVDQIKLQNYLTQIRIVDSTIKAYELAMSVDEAIANLTLSIAELERLNTDAFVMRTDALVRETDASLYYKETLLKKLSLMDADYAKEKLVIEESIAQLDKATREIEHLTSMEKLYADTELINSLKVQTINKSIAYNDIALNSLNSEFYGALDKDYRLNRKVEVSESNAEKLESELNAEISVANPTNANMENVAYQNHTRSYRYERQGWSDVHDASIEAAETLRRANMINTLTQTISSG